ncbi:MAG: hypothetical protein ABWY00_08575 [Dongiaceae bacterium]
MISDIKVPDSSVVRQAEELARAASSDMLFNHVMRCYWFGELFAQLEGAKIDSELLFLSAVLHDLGLTDLARGPHRFEIEGAGSARKFLVEQGVSPDRAQKVWDNIALHTWDINRFRDDTSRLMQLGLAYDVVGVADAKLNPADVAEVVQRYPRLRFKRRFHDLLCEEVDSKQPYEHFHHICTCIANSRSPLAMPNAQARLNGAPFDE